MSRRTSQQPSLAGLKTNKHALLPTIITSECGWPEWMGRRAGFGVVFLGTYFSSKLVPDGLYALTFGSGPRP